MNRNIETVNEEGSFVVDLLRKPFKLPSRYDDLPWESIEESKLTETDILDRKHVFPLLKVMPIRLFTTDIERSEMFESLKQYCQTERYNKFGADWPNELADSMGLDSLLDWDFDMEQIDDTASIPEYSPNHLLILTERTIHVLGSDAKFLAPNRIVDALVIPNQKCSDKNDTCILCLASGEIYSMDFHYHQTAEKYDIELVCSYKLDNVPPKFTAKLTYSSTNDLIGFVTSMHLMCVLSLHKRERAFFKLDFNVLLQLGCDIDTITWQSGKLLYIDYFKKNHVRVVEQDVQGYGFFECNFIINDVKDEDKILLLDRDNVLLVEGSMKKANIVSAGTEKIDVGSLDLVFASSADIIDYSLFKVIEEPFKSVNFLILNNWVILLSLVTDSNKVLVSELTRLAIPIDGLILERVVGYNEIAILVLSRGEVIRYTVDLNDITFQDTGINKLAIKPTVMLLNNILDEQWVFEGYEKIDHIYKYEHSTLLHSKNKLYDIPAKSADIQITFDLITFMSEFKVFHDVRVIDLKCAVSGSFQFGSISIRSDDPEVQQYVLIGISSICAPESYYLEIVKGEQIKFQLIDDLLPETEDTFIEFFTVRGTFLSITANNLYINDLEDIKQLPLPFSIKGAKSICIPKDIFSILIWNEDEISITDWKSGTTTSINIPEGFEKLHDIIEINGEQVLRFDQSIASIDLEKLEVLGSDFRNSLNCEGVLNEVWLKNCSSKTASLTSVRSLVEGRLEILSTDGNRTFVDAGTQMCLEPFVYPWVIAYSTSEIKIVNVQDGHVCAVFESDSLILNVYCGDRKGRNIFVLYEDGMSVNELLIDVTRGKLIELIGTDSLNWNEYKWPLQVAGGSRIILNDNAFKFLKIDTNGKTFVKQGPRKVPGSIITYGMLDDSNKHMCIFSYDTITHTLWCNIFTIQNSELTHLSEITVSKDLNIIGAPQGSSNTSIHGQFYAVTTENNHIYVWRVRSDGNSNWNVTLWQTINPGNKPETEFNDDTFYFTQNYMLQLPQNTDKTPATIHCTIPSSYRQLFRDP